MDTLSDNVTLFEYTNCSKRVADRIPEQSSDQLLDVSIAQRWAIVLAVATLAVPGLILNLLVSVISLRKNMVYGDYKLFLFNIALIDFIHSVAVVFLEPIVALLDLYDDFVCKLTGFLYAASAVCMIATPVLLSLNRYIKLCHASAFTIIFTKRNVVLICFLTNLAAGSLVLLYGVHLAGFDNYESGLFCTLSFSNDLSIGNQAFTSVFILLSLLCFTLSIYCNRKLYKKLQEQRKALANAHQTRVWRSNQDLLRVAIVQALVPVACQIPLILNRLRRMFYERNIWVDIGIIIIYLFNPACDALITLYVVRPYRKAISYWWRSLRSMRCQCRWNDGKTSTAVHPH